jgi:pentatricopeptide repeat protein
MIKGFCKYQQLDNAFSVFRDMKSRGIKADEVLYNSLLDGCSKNGRIDLAFQLYDEMMRENVRASTITYNSLIDACVRSNHINKAWEVLSKIFSQSLIDGVQPDNFTYSTLIKGIRSEEQTSDLERAFNLFHTMKDNPNFAPDEVLFNVLLDACINCK